MAKAVLEKHVKLNVKVSGKFVFVDKGGLRFSNTKPKPVYEFFAQNVGPNKGLRRAVRKALEAAGRHDLAHASVHTHVWMPGVRLHEGD